MTNRKAISAPKIKRTPSRSGATDWGANAAHLGVGGFLGMGEKDVAARPRGVCDTSDMRTTRW
jgi:hypothetical protein